MSNQKPDIDRLFRQRFDDWEAPHDAGEAHEVFNQVQQNLAQPGNGSPSTGGDGGGFISSGAKSLLGGAKGWLISGVTALMISGGAGYLFYAGDEETAPDGPEMVQADSAVAPSSGKQAQPSGESLGSHRSADDLPTKNDGKSNHNPDSYTDGRQEHPDAQQSNQMNPEASQDLNKERLSQSLKKAEDNRSKRASKDAKQPSSKKARQGANSASSSRVDAQSYQFKVHKTKLCPYEKLRFSVRGLSDNQTLSYKVGDRTFQPLQGNRHLVSIPSSTKHTTLIIRIAGENVYYDTQKLHVLPQPTAAFQVQKPGPLEVGLKAETGQTANHQWLLGNGDQKRQAKFRYTYSNGGAKTIKMIAANEQGCMDTAHKRIRLKPAPEVDLPNIFTPNGDGRNDKLVVSHGSLDSFKLVIKNEQGEVVFSTTDPERSWNGKVNNEGTSCNEGAYQYVLRYQYEFSSKFYQKTGKLLLKRSAFK